jgi:hypothetical protein
MAEPPSVYASIEGYCVRCRAVRKLQLIQGTFELRCPTCTTVWPTLDGYCDLAASMGHDVTALRRALQNSARAQGWRPPDSS